MSANELAGYISHPSSSGPSFPIGCVCLCLTLVYCTTEDNYSLLTGGRTLLFTVKTYVNRLCGPRHFAIRSNIQSNLPKHVQRQTHCVRAAPVHHATTDLRAIILTRCGAEERGEGGEGATGSCVGRATERPPPVRCASLPCHTAAAGNSFMQISLSLSLSLFALTMMHHGQLQYSRRRR